MPALTLQEYNAPLPAGIGNIQEMANTYGEPPARSDYFIRQAGDVWQVVDCEITHWIAECDSYEQAVEVMWKTVIP